MKLLIICSAIFMAPLMASASSTTCKAIIDARYKNEGAPFSTVDKLKAVKTIKEGHDQLTDSEAESLVNLLMLSNVEAYSAYDSSDAGYHLLVVDKAQCNTLWSGFVQMY